MEARIAEFVEVLRQNGVRVGTSEVADAVTASSIIGVEDRALFRSALETTLIKRDADLEPFLRAFEFYFSGAARTFEALEESLFRQIEEKGLLEGDELKMVLATLEQLLPQIAPLTQAALKSDKTQLANLFRGASLQLDFGRMESTLQTGFFSRRLLAGAGGGDRMWSDLQALEAELKRRGVSAEGLEIVSKKLSDALRKVEEAARKEVANQGRARLRKSEGGLAERNLQTLSRAEVEQMEGAVRKLAEKLKTRLIRKQRSRRKGALNVRRTLRRNMSWGGVPMIPVFRTRRPERPEVVVLCDVSDSVRNASRMMLLFMHTLQSLFTRVRSFVFVSDIGEVTRYFKELEVDRAIDVATAGKTISLHANSNYGRALATFARNELGAITRRTTVLVIGDGRNNFNAANEWALSDLKRKARRLIWICSEDRRSWGFGDSEMARYAQQCTQTVVVQSLGDLSRVAEQLVPV